MDNNLIAMRLIPSDIIFVNLLSTVKRTTSELFIFRQVAIVQSNADCLTAKGDLTGNLNLFILRYISDNRKRVDEDPGELLQ